MASRWWRKKDKKDNHIQIMYWKGGLYCIKVAIFGRRRGRRNGMGTINNLNYYVVVDQIY